jgi:aminopeptidase N
MKFICRELLFIIILFQTFSLSAQSNIDVLHYKFELGLNDQNDTIYGCAEIKFRFLQPISSITFDLASTNVQGKGMKVDRVTSGLDEPLKFNEQNDKVNIILLKQSGINDSANFTIFYHGVPRDGLIISKNKYGDRTFFADNWPDRAHSWIPCKDEPGDKASFEFIVTAPAQYQVISNGKLSEEKILPDHKKLTHWVEEVSLPTKVMVIGVAKFAVRQFADSPPNIPVSAWVYPQDSIKGFQNYSVAPAILKFYSGYIGPYPYNKLANVQSKTKFGGMENASAIFYYEESAEENKPVEDLLAHEIAHQWFGDMATEKSFPHLWLSEGFATYLTDLYFESKYGREIMNKRLIDERKAVINFAKHSNKPVVDSLSPFMNLLNANSYQKGAWVLHMLRKEVGDSAFHLFVKKYYDQYKGKNADTDDLLNVAEEVTHKDLKQFFRQWLYTPGVPQLNIRWHYNEKNKSLSITIIQQQKQDAFQLPLEIKLQFLNGTAQNETFNLTKQIESFSIPVKDVVLNIFPDPNTSLLFDGKIERVNNENKN